MPTTSPPDVKSAIAVIGASANNLVDVDVRIARNSVTAVVGVSGSGKSSLVHDTIAAVAAHRTAAFLGLRTHPALGEIHAFVGATPPTVVVGQRAFHASTRTTVATATPLLQLLRRLFLRHSVPIAPGLGVPVPSPTPDIVAQWLVKYQTGRVSVWVVPVRDTYTDGIDTARALAAAGIAECTIYSETDRGKNAASGTRTLTIKFKGLKANVRHTIEALVGESRVGAKGQAAVRDLLRSAWQFGAGSVYVQLHESSSPELQGRFSHGLDLRVHRVHPDSPLVFRNPESHLFSFNAPQAEGSGACTTCAGTGASESVQEELLVARPELSMHGGALALWTAKNYRYVNIQHSTIEGLRGLDGFDPDVPWRRLPASARRMILEGSPEPIVDIDPRTRKKMSAPHAFAGFRAAILDRIQRRTNTGESLRRFVAVGACPTCGGSRWRPETRYLQVGGWSLDQILALPFSELLETCVSWRAAAHRGAASKEASREIDALIKAVAAIAQSFVRMGLAHLSGNRGMLHVSGGEARRIQLGAAFSSRLAGLLLVLDEPSRGLHETDLDRLSRVISEVARTHTVLMSEHRSKLVAAADDVIQLGPGAGPQGGRLVKSPPTPTLELSAAATRNLGPPRYLLEVIGASIHNVRDQSVSIPLGSLTCIAGVSGSGKSSLLRGVILPALVEAVPAANINTDDFRTERGSWQEVRGAEHIRHVYAFQQAVHSGQPRSLVATYLGVADALRQEFASTAAARQMGLTASDFGTNAGCGRCQTCMGLGHAPDESTCPVCGGLRFTADLLSVRLAGLNMAEWLDLPVAQVCETPLGVRFEPLMQCAQALGIGHLSLGRSLSTLSGGEVQRLKLARAIGVEQVSRAVFILDEPACGLHHSDVESLYVALTQILAGGRNTVIAVEHDPYLLARCDHLIEFGPRGGPDGGRVIAQGSPDDIRRGKTPTADALRTHGSTVPAKAAEAIHERLRDPADLAEARAARQEMRHVLGDDVVPPESMNTVRPAALFRRIEPFTRPLDLAGLDRALASVALGLLEPVALQLQRLLDAWEHHPSASLRIAPMLDAVAQWGKYIPASEVKRTRAHVRTIQFDDFSFATLDPLAARTSGERLRNRTSTKQRLLALREAWAFGAGWVELVDQSGKQVAIASERLMDTKGPYVGPRRAESRHFCRAGVGACPACKGTGRVQDLVEGLLIGNRQVDVLAEDFIAPPLASQFKGMRRNHMMPFFRRMKAEGLWRDVQWNRMAAEEKAVLLWGFWRRPGLGTFLKDGAGKDGSQVNHWLMWDGLVHYAREQLASDELVAGETQRDCPFCEGTGLSHNARVLQIAGRSLQEWTRSAMVSELVSALKGLSPPSARGRAELERLLHCLTPLAAVPLNGPVPEPLGEQVLSLAARAYVGLSTFFESNDVQAVPW